MLCQTHNVGFSVPAVFRSKARCEGNGRSLVEQRNAAAGHHRDAHRVSLCAPTDCVAPLGKGGALTGEARLAVDAHKLTEPGIMRLKEH